MARAGILREDDRVELLDGEILEMTPISSRHAACVNRLTQLFSDQVKKRVIVSVQNPLRLGERSEPQPDLALLRARADFYARTHPGPEDVLLVVEVAETSGPLDREIKVPFYARAGVPAVWLVDLAEDCIEVSQRPTAQGYQEVRRVGRGERLTPHPFPDIELAAEEILG